MVIKEQPVLCVSRCLGFESCRFNGGIINDETIEKLKGFVKFITVCPECDMGLPTPREALRIIEKENTYHLIEPKSKVNYTERLTDFSLSFVSQLAEVDAFILKGRSPSCGVKDVKIYCSLEKNAASKKGNGIFAGFLLEKYPGYPVEDEGRLTNFKIRESYYTKIFILSEFRYLKKNKSMEALNAFHSRNKMLLNSFNIKETKEMGRVIANHTHDDLEKVFEQYELHLRLALVKSPRYTSNINILQHSFGYFSKYITSEEKDFILDSIEKYRLGQLPLSAPLNIIKAYVVRFDIDYLKSQSFFEPYPSELVEMRDSGKSV